MRPFVGVLASLAVAAAVDPAGVRTQEAAAGQSRRAALAALAAAHRFPVAGLELLRDEAIEEFPRDWSVKARVMAILRDGADNYIVLDRAEEPGAVRKVVIAQPGTPVADLVRLARELPDVGAAPAVDAAAAPGSASAHAPGDPAVPHDEDALAREAAEWRRNLHKPVPIPLTDLGTANPPPGSTLIVPSDPPVFRDLGALSPNAPAAGGSGAPSDGARPPLQARPALATHVPQLMQPPSLRRR